MWRHKAERTSNARSLRSLRMENNAGRVHPLFSVKKRKKDLGGKESRNASEIMAETGHIRHKLRMLFECLSRSLSRDM
jgi:hypothetical protein